MPTEESMSYLELKGSLENMLKGINKHSPDSNFPSNITAAMVEEQLASLVQKRKGYTEAEAIARQKSEEYNVEEKKVDTFFSNLSEQVYGVYGKQNLLVADYGLKIWQKHRGRKSGSSKTATK
jgi:hypothetical protein